MKRSLEESSSTDSGDSCVVAGSATKRQVTSKTDTSQFCDTVATRASVEKKWSSQSAQCLALQRCVVAANCASENRRPLASTDWFMFVTSLDATRIRADQLEAEKREAARSTKTSLTVDRASESEEEEAGEDSSFYFHWLELLFGDKLEDWPEFLEANANNSVAIVADKHSIWRGAITFSLFDQWCHSGATDGGSERSRRLVVKIPLAGIDLHYRRQKLGSALLIYLMECVLRAVCHNSSPHSGYRPQDVDFIVLAVESKQALAYWKGNGFVAIGTVAHCECAQKYSKESLVQNGVIEEIEDHLLPMIYTGKKSTTLVADSGLIAAHMEKPRYVNFEKRYATKEERVIIRRELEEKKQTEAALAKSGETQSAPTDRGVTTLAQLADRSGTDDDSSFDIEAEESFEDESDASDDEDID